jgi:hypothetical protein
MTGPAISLIDWDRLETMLGITMLPWQREVLQRWRFGDPEVEPPGALVNGRRHILSTHHVGGELVYYVLAAPLRAGDWLQIGDLGDKPVNLAAVICGKSVRFQANVHCPRCWEFGSHPIQVPAAFDPDPFLVRQCCTAWRQYPQEM